MTRGSANEQRSIFADAAKNVDLEIGRQVRLRRILLGLSQTQLASALSVSPQQVALFEKGENRLYAAQLFLLGRTLGVPVDFFFLTLKPKLSPDHLASDYGKRIRTESLEEELLTRADGRSLRELKELIKALSLIPTGAKRRRLLKTLQELTKVNIGDKVTSTRDKK